MGTEFYRISNIKQISKIKELGIFIVFFVLIGSMLGQAHAAIPETERDALIALYNDTTGASWTDSTGWMDAVGTECSWYGVTCENVAPGEDTVIELVLTNNNLNGTIPSALGNLENLERLYLNTNQLSGSIPIELGNLDNLRNLSVSRNQLSGGIPPELGSLTNIEELYLYSNQLTGSIPSTMFDSGKLMNLRILRLDSNQLTGSIPAELGNLMNLESLYLFSNQLSSGIPPQLGSLRNLEYLFSLF